MVTAGSRAEQAAFDLWKTLAPDQAYIAGLDEAVGKFFVPTSANVRRTRARIAKARALAKDGTLRKFLASLDAGLTLPEPARMPEAMTASFFGYMIKEDVVPEHMAALATAGAKALDAERSRRAGTRWPAGMRALVQLSASGLAEILDIVEKELQLGSGHEDALAAVARLRAALGRYRAAFDLAGFRPEGTFEETYAFLRDHGAALGRTRTYAKSLRALWDYRETPAQVEAAGMRMIRRELPRFRAITVAMAGDLHCDPTPEAVMQALRSRYGLRPDQVLAFLGAVRDPCRRVADKHVVGITPRYSTLVIETPPYFVNTTPSGAEYSIDSLTDHSREVFMATTDPRSAARPPPGELLNLLVHEEYGHAVHGSNTSHAFAGTPTLVDQLGSSFGCVSEGIAFQRELEFLPVMNGIASGRYDGPEERALGEALEPWGGISATARQFEFLTYLWRVMRFLRVVGDARINSGKQDIIAFVDWAHRTYGMERATVYNNVFPAHQILGAGYASTYAIIGERIREIQEKAAKRGISLRDLNAFASSIGWPPKSVFEQRLAGWVRAH